MEQHDQFVSSMQSRSAKLQVILNEVLLMVYWRPLLVLYIYLDPLHKFLMVILPLYYGGTEWGINFISLKCEVVRMIFLM